MRVEGVMLDSHQYQNTKRDVNASLFQVSVLFSFRLFFSFMCIKNPINNGINTDVKVTEEFINKKDAQRYYNIDRLTSDRGIGIPNSSKAV